MDSYRFEKEHIAKLKRFVKTEFYAAIKDERIDAEKLNARLKSLVAEETTLIQKNFKGVLSDRILKQQLDRIEKETAEIESYF